MLVFKWPLTLADCSWIKEGRNLIITGATGTGKTYLTSAFGNAACRKGLKIRSFRVNRLLGNKTNSSVLNVSPNLK
ncbi:MAG: ATP-binding protein [Syntrophaceticus sp.]|nr:ATP-binding protein [Syntrophaceticus sp.]MDD4360802.1 ATP-binding protein [Syntrophaceticus sp.]MDD4783985.1 ATP-binding protein [Syntrophaceticus sp.]